MRDAAVISLRMGRDGHLEGWGRGAKQWKFLSKG